MPLITISSLGSRGRAGNAMFQWAFARAYAKAMGCDLQTPRWWGRHIFQEADDEPLIDRDLPQTLCDSVDPRLGSFIGKKDIDLFGYFQNQLFIDFYNRTQVREWFRLSPEFEFYAPASRGESGYSAKHLRRGDYTTDPTFTRLYCTISEESYDRAVEQFQIPQPISRVCDCGNECDKLRAMGVGWLPDWLLLRDADHLLRSNSTFAWWAATLGHGKVYSPVVGSKVGLQHVPFVEGNHPNTAGVFQNQSDLFLKD